MSVCSLWDTRATDMQTRLAYFTFLLCWRSPSTETFVQIYILPHNKEWIYISNYAATVWSSESWLRLEPVELDLFTKEDVSDIRVGTWRSVVIKFSESLFVMNDFSVGELSDYAHWSDANITPEWCHIIMYYYFVSPTDLILLTAASYSGRIFQIKGNTNSFRFYNNQPSRQKKILPLYVSANH